MTPEAAEQVSIKGIGYLAGDHEQLSRFLALTGMSPQDIRPQIAETSFQVAILDFFLGHEPTLLSFAASIGIDPSDILKAKQALDPRETDDW